MAVTVLHTPFVVLDEGDRIVGVGPDAESQFGPLVGSVLWDCFPGSEPLFKPYYDAARRTAEVVEFVQFYDGSIARVRAVPRENGELELSWKILTRLDTLTIDGLAQTLATSLDLLDEEHVGADRVVRRRNLRLVEREA